MLAGSYLGSVSGHFGWSLNPPARAAFCLSFSLFRLNNTNPEGYSLIKVPLPVILNFDAWAGVRNFVLDFRLDHGWERRIIIVVTWYKLYCIVFCEIDIEFWEVNGRA